MKTPLHVFFFLGLVYIDNYNVFLWLWVSELPNVVLSSVIAIFVSFQIHGRFNKEQKQQKYFSVFFWQRTAEGFILFFPYVFLFRLTTLPVACIFFPFSPHAFDFFSMLQLFTLTLNGLVMCMRGRTNTWWQAGIKPLVNSRWKAKCPVWSKCVRISLSLPFIVSGTFSWHFYHYEKQFEGLGAGLFNSVLTITNEEMFSGLMEWLHGNRKLAQYWTSVPASQQEQADNRMWGRQQVWPSQEIRPGARQAQAPLKHSNTRSWNREAHTDPLLSQESDRLDSR